MNDLTDQERDYDKNRPVGRLGVRPLDQRELVEQLHNWGRWLGNGKASYLPRSIHPIQRMINIKNQDDVEVTHARAIINSFDANIMERIDALIGEGMVQDPLLRRPGAMRNLHAQILCAEYHYRSRFRSARARKVKKQDGVPISVKWYSDQLPKAVESLLKKYNDPNIFVA